MLFYLFAFFVLLPLVELTLLLWLGQATDWKVSVLVVIATGLAGSYLTRLQGARALRRVQAELAQGRMPADAIWDGFFIFAAGLLLITPGLITDLIGISLLIPPCRNACKRYFVRRFRDKFQMRWRTPPGGMGDESRVIDSYVVETNRPDPDPPS